MREEVEFRSRVATVLDASGLTEVMDCDKVAYSDTPAFSREKSYGEVSNSQRA
jgi:hypothetical protein